uniref:Uncharacterized protein n=1 Tax=Rhizophora mucronata TaxID=61149 RepID=A0A2P2QPG1_RHIMU
MWILYKSSRHVSTVGRSKFSKIMTFPTIESFLSKESICKRLSANNQQ